MILTKKQVSKPNLTLEPKSLIVDIETTGFSPKYASIYMIGIVYKMEDAYTSEQWLCEKASDEYELLFKFNQLLEDCPTLYHYNGDTFDMPFIKKRMALYGISCGNYKSVDLLKTARSFKKTLNLENLKLTTIEAYFGYERKDKYKGGELIEVYKTYVASHSKDLMATLLLHNYEDLLGLMDVLQQLPLFDFLQTLRQGRFQISLNHSSMENGHYIAGFPIPNLKDTVLTIKDYSLELSDNTGTLRVPIIGSELYYFFPDHKNYIYLTSEDYAIHKSIGQFVAKAHRQKATKETAYVKKEGFFLPGSKRQALKVPLYYKDKKQKEGFVSIEDLVETNGFNHYVTQLLKDI